MFQFGIGGMFAVPSATVGNPATPSYPQEFGTIQGVDVEITQKLVSLMGQNKFPDDVAPSDMKISGKAGFAKIELDIYNALFYGETTATGITAIASLESHAIPATPFQVTITPPSSGTFGTDLGVLNAANGQPFIKDTGGTPAAGHYKVAGAVYTFASADNVSGISVLISYTYTLAGGNTLTVTNRIQGYGPVFELWLSEPYQGTNGLHLYQCRASKMSNPLKRDGYLISDFEFEAYANAAGKVADFFQISA